MSGGTLYFIAILLPDGLAEVVRGFQKYASEQFESGRALRSPPHITLVPPFQIPRAEEANLVDMIAGMHAPTGPFEVTLDGFDAFGNRVLYIHVHKSEAMRKLALYLNGHLRNAGFPLREENRPFHPHVTVAFRDLTPRMFRKAMDYFRGVDFHSRLPDGEGVFQAEKVTLLRHQEGRWDVVRHFHLKPS